MWYKLCRNFVICRSTKLFSICTYTNQPLKTDTMTADYMRYNRKIESILRGEVETSWIDELKTIAFWRAVGAEFLATMLFVFIGCTAIVSNALPPSVFVPLDKVVVVAFAFGLGIMAMVMLTGHVSGGHVNPAVTIAFAINLAISPFKALFYVIAQVVGAIAGAAILYGITDEARRGNVGTNGLTGITPAQGFGCELIMTFILVIVIMATTDDRRTTYAGIGLEIGLTVTLLHLAGINFTGASMNPARSFGPAVISGFTDYHWIYWIGPIVGGALAAVTYKYLICPYVVKSIDEAIDIVGSAPEKTSQRDERSMETSLHR